MYILPFLTISGFAMRHSFGTSDIAGPGGLKFDATCKVREGVCDAYILYTENAIQGLSLSFYTAFHLLSEKTL
jgi:hypothetical protein